MNIMKPAPVINRGINVGDVVQLHSSTRRNWNDAGKIGLVVDLDKHGNPIVNLDGTVKSFHHTQIGKVLK